jgi:hypothetical protein
MSTSDDLAHLEKVGISTDTVGWEMRFGANHWKYPQTVGNDTYTDDVNFNSNETSEYAKLRMNNTSGITREPFIMFEFMKITEKTNEEEEKIRDSLHSYIESASISEDQNILNEEFLGGAGLTEQDEELIKLNKQKKTELAARQAELAPKVRGFFSFQKAFRHYTGSISLYMPTDIQINDTMVYNDDTRKFGALVESIKEGEGVDFEAAQIMGSGPLAGIGAALGWGLDKIGKGGKSSSLISAVLGYGVGDIATAELQRTLGRTGNPNEFAAYENTSLRTFTFNWTILPDSVDESKQAAGLIKFFRKSAHATKNGPTRVTVPDECIVSFHGAGGKDVEMIQLPPCFVESVNVTYNPNTSSFFKQNNAPVEIGLAVGLKEIVPIYADDVERGY